jgi:hypothetical protein
MGWGKTLIITKDRRVIVDLGERRGGTESKKEIPSKEVRKIPDYSTIDRRQHVQYFTPDPLNNGHAKPGKLTSQAWLDGRTHIISMAQRTTTQQPKKLHNHSIVKGLNNRPTETYSGKIEYLPSKQIYPQRLEENNSLEYLQASTIPPYSSYYPNVNSLSQKYKPRT